MGDKMQTVVKGDKIQTVIIGAKELGFQVKIHRDHLGISQKGLAEQIGDAVNRSNIAHLEQGKRIPNPSILKLICESVNLPKEIWKDFIKKISVDRLNFEKSLSELSGTYVNADNLDEKIISVLENNLKKLFCGTLSTMQSFDCFNSIIVYYGLTPISRDFFEKYFQKDAFITPVAFNNAIKKFQKDAIRLFSTIQEAFYRINASAEVFSSMVLKLKEHNTKVYIDRTEWNQITKIANNDLRFLGYIAAKEVEAEEKERKYLTDFMKKVIAEKDKGIYDINKYNIKTQRKINSLLRKFNSTLEYGLFSPMFDADVLTLEKEIKYISPEASTDIPKMTDAQNAAYNNLSNYLTADYLDVYVATSMRVNADFISVNTFIEKLFAHSEIKQYKLRYFNPTQSWIEDRVAKGLVEALMLKRANICIYMAQKDDTFGKDSEASVTLGQGKSVIVYVPKLVYDDKIDSEALGKLERDDLISELKKEGTEEDKDIDESEDNESLLSRLLKLKLGKLELSALESIVRQHWADFDIENEFNKKIKDDTQLKEINNWFNKVIDNDSMTLSTALKEKLVDILVEASICFEKRAKIFREVHPLALQVILNTGVLNGILVVRSVESCAVLIRSLIENKLELELSIDEKNYMLIEKNTGSVIRVISKHQLISNAFKTYYTFDNDSA